ncbi:MAG: hypothetical protein JW841_15410 [Deltaproteobacteria bacterium]|nr:hypothetical protein [Deltaproteobacteria bacterium]
MRILRLFFLYTTLLLTTSIAMARTIDPGTFSVSGGIGPTIRYGSLLDAGRAYFLIQTQGEYSFSSQYSAVTDLSLGFGSSYPVRFHIGGRYRLTDFDLPIYPYAQLQFSLGKLFNVLGANLTFVGARVGAGADYFLTKNIGVGGIATLDLGSTTGIRPAFYGVTDILIYATYTFDRPPLSPAVLR